MQERPMSASFDPQTATLRVSGAVDEAHVELFERHLVEAKETGVRPVTVDLSDVDYFPSLAVGALARVTAPKDAGNSYDLVAAAGSIAQRVLFMTGMPHRES